MNQVKWGIVGTGTIANKFAQTVNNATGGKLVAVASRTAASASTFAARYGIAHAFSSYEDLAAFEGVDAVYIALPHTYHSKYSNYFLQAGKHVLCEKPVSVNLKDLQETRSIANKTGLFMMEAMWTRFLPAIHKIQEIISAGVIGEVKEVSADFCYALSDLDNNVYKNEYAGGALLDVGIYGLTFASIFLGDEIADIQTAAHKRNGVDDRIHILLTYKNGNIARISSALNLYKPEDGYIYGTKGYIRVPTFYGASAFEVITDDGAHRQAYSVSFKGNGFEEEIEECNNCILTGKAQSDVHPLTQSAVIMRLMDEIRKQVGIVYPLD